MNLATCTNLFGQTFEAKIDGAQIFVRENYGPAYHDWILADVCGGNTPTSLALSASLQGMLYLTVKYEELLNPLTHGSATDAETWTP